MQKIIEDVTSPEWWFSVVVVALLVGALGAYLVRLFDGTGKRLANILAAKSAADITRRNTRTEYYTKNPQLVPFLVAGQLRLYIVSCSLMVCTIAFACALLIVNAVPYPGMPRIGVQVFTVLFGGSSAMACVMSFLVLRRAAELTLVAVAVQTALETKP